MLYADCSTQMSYRWGLNMDTWREMKYLSISFSTSLRKCFVSNFSSLYSSIDLLLLVLCKYGPWVAVVVVIAVVIW